MYRHSMFVTPVFEHITREVIMHIRTTILTIVLSLLFITPITLPQIASGTNPIDFTLNF